MSVPFLAAARCQLILTTTACRAVMPGANNEDSLGVELLNFATLLVRHASRSVVDHRKTIIGYASNFFKSLHVTAKTAALLLSCYFIRAFETRDKVILQVSFLCSARRSPSVCVTNKRSWSAAPRRST